MVVGAPEVERGMSRTWARSRHPSSAVATATVPPFLKGSTRNSPTETAGACCGSTCGARRRGAVPGRDRRRGEGVVCRQVHPVGQPRKPTVSLVSLTPLCARARTRNGDIPRRGTAGGTWEPSAPYIGGWRWCWFSPPLATAAVMSKGGEAGDATRQPRLWRCRCRCAP